MKKRGCFFCALLLLPMVLSSCGASTADASRVELSKKGEIIEYTVENFDAVNYDAEEFETFVDNAVEEYEESGSGKVKVTHEEVEEETVNLTMTYDEPDTYAAFNQVTCFSGTIEEARMAGYDFSMDFLAADTRQSVPATSFFLDESLLVFIVETDVDVQIPGVVQYYYSSFGTAVNKEEDTVQVAVSEDLIGTQNLVYVVYSEEE